MGKVHSEEAIGLTPTSSYSLFQHESALGQHRLRRLVTDERMRRWMDVNMDRCNM